MGIRSAGYCSLEIDFVSEWGRYNARQKIPAMDSTKAYSHCWDFLLAEVGIRVITIKLSSS